MMKKILSCSALAGMMIAVFVGGQNVEASKQVDNVTSIKEDTVALTRNVTNEPLMTATKENKKTESKKTENVYVADGMVSEDDFGVLINNIKIMFGEDINKYIKELGEPDEYDHARSCMDDGEEKKYLYGDVMLCTYPNGKKDILYNVVYTGKTPTLSGIKCGSTLNEVIKAYGKDYVEEEDHIEYIYDESGSLWIDLKNGKVEGIDIYLK